MCDAIHLLGRCQLPLLVGQVLTDAKLGDGCGLLQAVVVLYAVQLLCMSIGMWCVQ